MSTFLREALADVSNVELDVFSELVVDFARRWGAKTMVKGLRVISDFEWEFQMNHLNRTLAPEIETVYVMARPQYSFVSSSGVEGGRGFRRQRGGARAARRGAALPRALSRTAARGRPRTRPSRRDARPGLGVGSDGAGPQRAALRLYGPATGSGAWIRVASDTMRSLDQQHQP